MHQLAGDMRLVEEQLAHKLGLRRLHVRIGRVDLDGHVAVGEGVVGEVDDAGGAATQLLADGVLAELLGYFDCHWQAAFWIMPLSAPGTASTVWGVVGFTLKTSLPAASRSASRSRVWE